MKKIFFIFVFFAVFAGVFAQQYSRTITIRGTGTEPASAKFAIVDMAVVTKNSSAKEAVRENAQKMAAVQDALKEFGLDESAFSTSNFSVYQEMEYSDKKSHPGAYRVSNSLQVKFPSESDVGEIIDRAIDAGVNEFSNIRFLPDDYVSALKIAREKAVQDAVETAKILADAAGLRVVRIVSISEDGGTPSAPRFYNKATVAMDESGATTSIIAGDTNVSANVSIVFEIE